MEKAKLKENDDLSLPSLLFSDFLWKYFRSYFVFLLFYIVFLLNFAKLAAGIFGFQLLF